MGIIPQLFQYGIGIAAVCALLWFVASWTGNLNKGAVELASKAEAEAAVEYIRGTGVKAKTDGSFKLDGVRRYRLHLRDARRTSEVRVRTLSAWYAGYMAFDETLQPRDTAGQFAHWGGIAERISPTRESSSERRVS